MGNPHESFQFDSRVRQDGVGFVERRTRVDGLRRAFAQRRRLRHANDFQRHELAVRRQKPDCQLYVAAGLRRDHHRQKNFLALHKDKISESISLISTADHH